MHFKQLFRYCPVCSHNRFVENDEKSKRCEKCGFVFYQNPSAAVAAFILNDNNELLVCRRARQPFIGTFDLPGGFVDASETAEQAVKREIKEETNLDVTTLNYLFSLPNIYPYSNLDIPTLDLFYACKCTDKEKARPSDDAAELYWIPVGELNPALFGLQSIRKAITYYISTC